MGICGGGYWSHNIVQDSSFDDGKFFEEKIYTAYILE